MKNDSTEQVCNVAIGHVFDVVVAFELAFERIWLVFVVVFGRVLIAIFFLMVLIATFLLTVGKIDCESKRVVETKAAFAKIAASDFAVFESPYFLCNDVDYIKQW